MSPTLQRIVTAHGSFPETALVPEGFAAVFAAASGETAADVTDALLTLVDQLADGFAPMPPEIGAQLTHWAAHVATDLSVRASAIVALLVNAGTPEAEAALERLAASNDRPDLAEAAAEGLAELREPDAEAETPATG
jgi:HEAT repeat protein